MTRTSLTTVVVITTLTLSACGTPSDTATSLADSASTTTQPQQTTTTTAGLPGIQAFGLTNEEFAQNVEAVEALIATCMSDAGFEYVPVDVTTMLELGKWVHADPNMSREEYKTKWGYGVSIRTDNPTRDIALGAQNLRIYADLSEPDQIAYDRTLFGDDTDAVFAIVLDDEDFSGTGGCTKQAIDAVFPTEMLAGTFVNPKDILVESDPRVIKADEQWLDCMGEGGYDYEDQDEIIEEYGEQFDVVTNGEDPDTLTGPALDALHQLQGDEIAVALKDLQCQLDFVDDVIREVEIEIFGAPVSG